MKEEKVSIIIPAYNVEKYLEECILSIENQEYKNIEILLIDDGSTDNTSKISDNLAKKYANIRVEHIKNGGVSNARNIGIALSTGKYIMFIDSDDYIENNMVSLLVETMEQKKAELVVCNYSFCYTNRIEIAQLNVKEELNQKETKKELFKNTSIRGFMCNKKFLSNIIKENKLAFNKDIKICEDLLFCFQYASFLNKTVVLNESLYNYRMRKSSASNSNVEKDLSIFDAFNEMAKIDSNVYTYDIDFYTYIYFKYYKELKKKKELRNVKKISLFSSLFNKKIKRKTKLYSILFLILPTKIKKSIKRKQKNNLQYYE